jgi:lactate dehydrogenase-like 2-hydroxyacid dehydrogenase
VEEVADSALSHLLNITRKTHTLANGVKAGGWPASESKGALRFEQHEKCF